jgi:secreted trypsin-like serine protease
MVSCVLVSETSSLRESIFTFCIWFVKGGELGKDACTGDGGSPLVCSIDSDPDRFYLSGIVAGGISCGEKDIPGLYVDVSKYHEWVDQNMQELSLETSTYKFDDYAN